MSDVVDRNEALAEVERITEQENLATDLQDELELQERFERMEDQKMQTVLDKRAQLEIIEMRGEWSGWILFTIVLIVVSNITVIFLTGFGVMSFSSEVILPVFLGESLLQTIGLAAIIVNFLFNKDFLRRGEK